MERKTAITTAAAITLTMFAGGAAIAANAGILANAPDDALGQMSPIAQVETSTTTGATVPVTPEVQTIIVDEYVRDGRAATAPAGAVAPGATTAPTTPPATAPSSPAAPAAPAAPPEPSAPEATTTTVYSGGGSTHGDDDGYGDDEDEHEDDHDGHDDDD